MAKVNLPALSGEARGKIGDIVFMKRYGTQIARIRTKPANPRTEKQMIVRGNLGSLSDAWKGEDVVLKKYDPQNGIAEVHFQGLSDTEREAWMEYAMRQNKPKQFARILFIGENQRRLMKNQDPIRVP